MNTSDAMTVAFAVGSLAALVVEVAVRDPRAAWEILADVEGFARRSVPKVAAAPALGQAAYVGCTVAAAVLLFLEA